MKLLEEKATKLKSNPFIPNDEEVDSSIPNIIPTSNIPQGVYLKPRQRGKTDEAWNAFRELNKNYFNELVKKTQIHLGKEIGKAKDNLMNSSQLPSSNDNYTVYKSPDTGIEYTVMNIPLYDDIMYYGSGPLNQSDLNITNNSTSLDLEQLKRDHQLLEQELWNTINGNT
tara:strand:+ start:2153 stop:2662 length:510 start_codon:yes stop_codon:yes gene_type:complete